MFIRKSNEDKIREIGKYVIDFEMQAAYLLVDVELYHVWDYRTGTGEREVKTLRELPNHIREFMLAKQNILVIKPIGNINYVK